MGSRKNNNMNMSSRKNNNMTGGAGSKWTRFVKKVHQQLKKKNPKASLGDAMKAASKRKSEM